MKRRDFLCLAITQTASLITGRNAEAATTQFNALAEIKKHRITGGAMAGAFVIAPYGYVNWYFANLGLYPFVGSLKTEVKAYLNLYLRRLYPTRFNIADVLLNYSTSPTAPSIASLHQQDSDDAYAATFLSLASRYDAVTNDTAWWNANVGTLKNIAYKNLTTRHKPSGLVRAYQDTTVKLTASVGYLMDNCEVYRGLREFSARLQAHQDLDAGYYKAHAASVAIGIRSLFDATQKAFRVSDVSAAVMVNFYPDATAQVFPQAYTVATKGIGSEQYNQAWNYLNNVAPGWENGNKDDFPWMMLGYVAALRGGEDRSKAITLMRALENLCVTNRSKVTINELGFYKRTANIIGVLT